MKRTTLLVTFTLIVVVLATIVMAGCGGGAEVPEGEVIIGGGGQNDDVTGTSEKPQAGNSTTTEARGLDSLEGSGSETTTGSQTSDDNEPALPAFIQVISPTEGQVIKGTKVRIEVKVTGFKLVNKFGEPAKAGEGHIHYTVDDAEPIPSDKTTFEANISPQPHTVKVELRNNDHTPLDPPVEAVAHFSTSVN